MSEPSRASDALPAPRASTAKVIGRYALYDEFASGGMASLHFGRLYGSAGFARTVAIKRLHTNLAGQPEFVSMLVDEARLAARIRHPNVVPTLDVVSSDGELLLVMEYVHGMSLAQLLATAAEKKMQCPVPVAMAIACDMLRGLHAAHEAKSEVGVALELVHRDVSPQNVLVGADGVARVVDFGVAKAAGRIQETRDGELKGKVPYMAPEQLKGEPASRRSDVYGAGVVLWECLTGRRLFRGDNDASVWLRVLNDPVKAPSSFVRGIPRDLDDIVIAATAKDPQRRYATAIEMAKKIEEVCPLASPTEVGAWVEQLGHEDLDHRARVLARVEHAAAPSEPAVAEMVTETQNLDDSPRRSRALGAAVFVAVLAMAFALTGILLRAVPGRSIPEASAATGAVSSSAGSLDVPGQDAAIAPSSATPDAGTVVSLDDPIVPPQPTQKPIEKRKLPKTTPPPPKSCDPPFVIDSAGHKTYKDYCFK